MAHGRTTTSNSPANNTGGLLSSDASERRCHFRVPFAAKVVLSELDSGDVPGAEFAGEAVDLSRSGIGVRSRRMYYLGARLAIKFVLPNGRAMVKCGIVRTSRYASEAIYHVGIEFCAVPSGTRLASWIEEHETTH